MKTLRFRTRITKSGTIHLPKSSSLVDKEVDVIIMPKMKRFKKAMKGKEFVDKWAGLLNPLESDDSKFDYLMGKHQ
ncbi:MAG: hypothetical protein ACLFNU_13135 [Bacteroidales bacterium]